MTCRESGVGIFQRGLTQELPRNGGVFRQRGDAGCFNRQGKADSLVAAEKSIARRRAAFTTVRPGVQDLSQLRVRGSPPECA